MVEFTSRLGLAKPSTVGELVDVSLLNNNADQIDLYAAGPFECTSTTRPSAPYTGMLIYETDTDLIWRWTGTKWAFTAGQMFAQRWRSTSQSIPNNTSEKVSWSNAAGAYAKNGNFYNYHSTERMFEFTQDGLYEIKIWMSFDTNSTGRRQVGCRIANALDTGTLPTGRRVSLVSDPAITSGGNYMNDTFDLPIDLASGFKYLLTEVFQTSGGALNIGQASAGSELSNVPGIPRIQITRKPD